MNGRAHILTTHHHVPTDHQFVAWVDEPGTKCVPGWCIHVSEQMIHLEVRDKFLG